jgi:hypothetical protein
MNTQETIKELKTIAKALKKSAKIQAIVETEPNYGDDTVVELSLNYKRDVLQIKLGTPTDDDTATPPPSLEVVATSAKHRQAVLALVEGDRAVVKTVDLVKATKEAEPTHQEVISNFPVNLPPKSTYKVKSLGKEAHGDDGKYVAWRYEVTAKAPASKQSFLVGKDERHLFICALPKVAKSVAQAHEILKPKEIRGKKGVLRQGEFFFIPATKQELSALASEGKNGAELDSDPTNLDDGNSDHGAHNIATIYYAKRGKKGKKGKPVRDQKKEMVTGIVQNDRHSRLVLNGWYRVVKNTELEGQSDTWD